MFRRGIIVHGKPSREKYEASDTDPSDSHWIPWAKHKMNVAGIYTVAPDMPEPYNPKYPAWERAFDRTEPWYLGTTLVGISMGAGFLLRYFSEYQKLKPEKLVLVAPFLDLKGKYGDFNDFEIDPNLVERCAGGLAVFYSSKDDEQALASLEVIRTQLPEAKYMDIPHYGHFMLGNTMETVEFPELLPEVL